MEPIKVLNDRYISKKERFTKIGKPKALGVSMNNDEIIFEKASNAIDEVVKKLQGNINDLEAMNKRIINEFKDKYFNDNETNSYSGFSR